VFIGCGVRRGAAAPKYLSAQKRCSRALLVLYMLTGPVGFAGGGGGAAVQAQGSA
jgi:hypothetical protein